jgi:hypothetical protein
VTEYGSNIATFTADIWKDVKRSQPPVDSPLITHIAGLARVPTEGLVGLQKGIWFDLAREWQWYERSPINRHARRIGRGQVATLKRLSAQLCASLKDLNYDALEALALADLLILAEMNRDDHPQLGSRLRAGGEDFDQIQKIVATLAARASRAGDIYRPKPHYPVGRPARGGFSELPRPGSLPHFTLRLLWDVRAARGRLSLDKNSGTGTLVETLKLLSPHLPPGFIPKILPLSTLAKMHALDKKLAGIGADDRSFLVQLLGDKLPFD